MSEPKIGTNCTISAPSFCSRDDRDPRYKSQLLGGESASIYPADRLAKELRLTAEQRNALLRDMEKLIRAIANQQRSTTLPDKPRRDIRPRESILQYLRDEEGMGPWVKVGALTRPLLRHLSPRAYMALANWLRHNELPHDLSIPTRSEVVRAETTNL